MMSVLVVSCLLLLSCGYGSEGDESAGDGAAASDPFGHGTAIIDNGEETTMIEVEVAQDSEQRARGLMGRRSLPPDEGMVFVFFEETRTEFWMKNTLIPLSIAFLDEKGEILRILDMDPCRRDPCKLYDPGVAYWAALEVNQGAFERWGTKEGDVIRVVQ